jgi:hypothetical protein
MIHAVRMNDSIIFLSSLRINELMAVTTGTRIVIFPKRQYITGISRMVMMLRWTVPDIFIRKNERAREAIIAIAAVTRAFSSQKKRNIDTAGRKLNGYDAKEPFSMFFQVRNCIRPIRRDRISAPAGA